MEIKIVKREYSERVEVQKTKDVTVYVAKDGTEFSTERSCLSYEHDLQATENGENLFINLNQDEMASLIKFCFCGCGTISDENIIGFIVPDNEIEIQKMTDYLVANKFHSIPNFQNLKSHTIYAIATWIEDYHSDRPDYTGKTILYQEIKDKIKAFSDKIRSIG